MGGDDSKPQLPTIKEQIQNRQIPKLPADYNQDDLQKKPTLTKAEAISKPPFPQSKEKQKPIKIKKTKQKYKQKLNSQNSMNLKKGKEISIVHKSPHQIFFSDQIHNVSRSRLDILLQPFKGQPLKPIVQYDPQKRGIILIEQTRRFNKWNMLISDEPSNEAFKVKMIESYISLNEKSASQFKLRQIKKRLSDVKKGHLDSWIDQSIIEENKLINV